MGFVSFLCLL